MIDLLYRGIGGLQPTKNLLPSTFQEEDMIDLLYRWALADQEPLTSYFSGGGYD